MKINYEDFLDEYDDEDSFQRIKPKKKFRDSERASAGDNSYKKALRKKRQAKQKEREIKNHFEDDYHENEEEEY